MTGALELLFPADNHDAAWSLVAGVALPLLVDMADLTDLGSNDGVPGFNEPSGLCASPQ